MKYLLIFFLSSFLFSQGHPFLNYFVSNHLLLTKSKMESSPVLWQDFREGYYRARTIRTSDNLLDSLAIGVPAYNIAIEKLPELELLRIEALSGKEFEYYIEPKVRPSFHVNYFSSSID